MKDVIQTADAGDCIALTQPGPAATAVPPAPVVVSAESIRPVIDDEAILRSAGRGDGAAFHQLVDRHSAYLFRLAMSLSHNRPDAEDVLQETFTGAYRGLKNFDGRASVKTWLTQILLRQAAKQWHRSKASRTTRRIDQLPSTEAAGSLSVPGRTSNVERRLDLMAAIDALPDEHRAIVMLREVQGLTYQEIADALGVPRGTVESRLHRARANLRQRLVAYET